MQSANMAFWNTILAYKSKDVLWKIKCQILVDHVNAVFAFGSENWSWTILTMERIEGWETKTMLRLFRCERHKEENMGSPTIYTNVQYGKVDVDTDGLTLPT